MTRGLLEAPIEVATFINDDASDRQTLCEIARTAFEVVGELLDEDQSLAQMIRSETTTSRQIFREESITERMAITLLRRFPKNVEVTLFTPSEEARTGADWYWRFERGDGAIHARVQAKRVQRSEFGQQDRDGHVEIDHRQLDRLIEATQEASMRLTGLQAWLATFARFDATPPCGQDDLMRCPRHNHANACTRQMPSLWIAQASEIRRWTATTMSVRDVVARSVRLDCVLPCIDGPDARTGPEAKGFTRAAGLPSYPKCIDHILQDSTWLKSFEGAMRIVA